MLCPYCEQKFDTDYKKPITLPCSCNFCYTCASFIKKNFYICPLDNQRIEVDLNNINNDILKTIKFLCKEHKQECKGLCLLHLDILCESCLKDHQDCEIFKGTIKEVDSKLDEIYESAYQKAQSIKAEVNSSDFEFVKYYYDYIMKNPHISNSDIFDCLVKKLDDSRIRQGNNPLAVSDHPVQQLFNPNNGNLNHADHGNFIPVVPPGNVGAGVQIGGPNVENSENNSISELEMDKDELLKKLVDSMNHMDQFYNIDKNVDEELKNTLNSKINDLKSRGGNSSVILTSNLGKNLEPFGVFTFKISQNFADRVRISKIAFGGSSEPKNSILMSINQLSLVNNDESRDIYVGEIIIEHDPTTCIHEVDVEPFDLEANATLIVVVFIEGSSYVGVPPFQSGTSITDINGQNAYMIPILYMS